MNVGFKYKSIGFVALGLLGLAFGFSVSGLRIRVWGSGFRVLRVWGLGLRVEACTVAA